jgi:hypothetical protein
MVKKKVQRDKQRSKNQTHKTKDRVTRTPLNPGVNSGVHLLFYDYRRADTSTGSLLVSGV